MKSALLALGVSALALLSGCGALQLTPIKMTQQKPSNVALYFKVQTRGGEPVGGLGADGFRIYEDGQLVSDYESKQTILNPEVAAVHFTLLLVDMSGSVTASGTIGDLSQAVGTFVDRVEKEQRLAIYAFDGGPELTAILPFSDQPGNAKAAVAQLAAYKPKDPSTNLHGAVVKALDALDAALGKANQPLKFGTLVVFTDGTDRANRVSETEMKQHVREKPFDVFAIGLGAEIKPVLLGEIGKSGTAMAADRSAIVKAFDDIGAGIENRTKSYYLLSYCSPARAGQHEVRVEAVFKDPSGGAEKVGSLKASFDATGFAPGCDPKTPPSFDVSKGDTLAPPPDEKKTDKPDKSDKPDEKKSDKPDSKPDAKPAAPKPAASAAPAAKPPPASPPPASKPSQPPASALPPPPKPAAPPPATPPPPAQPPPADFNP